MDDVSIEVRPGEIVGLIGTNGAGKTTFMNAVSGFVPSRGDVELFGTPPRPGRRRTGAPAAGSDAASRTPKLFGALTVRETLMVALEARERSLLLPSMLYLPPSPSRSGASGGRPTRSSGTSGSAATPTRCSPSCRPARAASSSSARCVALDTKLMLLDEPTAGVAQRETEAFGPLIKQVQRELGASILIIEHDMPMVMSISDRIYCLEAGRVIAEGSPEHVRSDPLVIASYLGTDERAIQRSGPAEGA